MKVRNIYMTGLFIIWPVRDRWKEGLDHQEDHLLLTASEQASCSRLKILVTVPCARRCIRNAGRIHLPANWRVLKQQAQVYKKKSKKFMHTQTHAGLLPNLSPHFLLICFIFLWGWGGRGNKQLPIHYPTFKLIHILLCNHPHTLPPPPKQTNNPPLSKKKWK